MYVWRDGEFRLDHHIDTQQASDVVSVDINGAVWLAVATGGFVVTSPSQNCDRVCYHSLRFIWSNTLPIVT